MPHQPPRDAVLERWRRDARGALPAAADDLIEEIAQHLALQWQQARDAGETEDAADDRARRELAVWREGSSCGRLAAYWTGWVVEARQALRVWTRRPMFAGGMIGLTAIGIGANVAAFAVAYGLLWRPLPFPDASRLAVLWQVREGEATQVSLPDYRDVTSGTLFDAATAMSGGRGSLRIGTRIERVNMLALEPQGFAMLGARPALGRLLRPDDAGRRVVLISDRLWRTQFASDCAIVGQAVWVSGTTYEIAGVLEPGFDFELPVGRAFLLKDHDLWTLLDPADPLRDRRDVSSFEALVRLQAGMAVAETQAIVDGIGRRLASEHEATNRDRSFRVAPLRTEVVGGSRQTILLAGAAAVVTLLIALANIVTLSGVRIADRGQELAIRQALGAGAMRLRRQLATEHAALVAAGAILGMLSAKCLVTSLSANDAARIPLSGAIRFDGPVWLAAAILAAMIVLALSLLPLGARTRAGEALRSGRRSAGGARGLRTWATAGELALALALSAGGVLLGLSLLRLMSLDPGFAKSGVVTARVSAYAERHAGLPQVEAFITRVIGSIEALPGVDAAAAGSSLPLTGQTSGTSVAAEGEIVAPGSRPTAGWQFVTPGYFGALGMSLRRGRDFMAADRAHDGHVTIVNESLARMLFPGQDPIGKRITVGGGDATGDWHEIVGVVADVRHQALVSAPQPRVYDLFGEHWGRTLYLVARTQVGDPSAMVEPLRRGVAAIDPEAPVFDAAAMEDLVRRSAAPQRLSAGIAIGLALASLLLALAGVYAIASVSVVEREREIGIRAALGAAPGDVLALMLRDGLRTAVLGAAPGCVLAFVVARVIEAQLFGAASGDASLVVPIVVVLLIAATMGATLPPALRAAAMDPVTAMRAD